MVSKTAQKSSILLLPAIVLKKVVIMSRLESNLELLKILEEYIQNHPDIRFHQALWNLRITTEDSQYYEEPSDSLKRSRGVSES